MAHKLDSYRAIIHAGLHAFPKLSAKRLIDEVRAVGYAGCYSRSSDYVRTTRSVATGPTADSVACRPSPASPDGYTRCAGFTKLAEAGQSVSSISARLGMSERLAEQQLRFDNAAPGQLDAYRAEKIDLETLKAFVVTTDRERPLAVWDQVSAQGYRRRPGR